MSIYVLLTKLTGAGRHTLHARPERLLEVNQEVERFGCRILAQYAVLGAFDFVSIVEAPDNGAITQLSAHLGGRGTVSITTLSAIPIERYLARLDELAAAKVLKSVP
ncbi:MAG: Uncharacterized protein, contains GYD domain [Chloroflexi bacterium]|nr:MAG: Uncharacterized protein, contains GYD domain [Chloroflexota bacterium]